MLIQLSGLLRITLESVSRPQIPLSEELDVLDKFVQIEQTRLGDRLTVAFDVDSDILDAIVRWCRCTCVTCWARWPGRSWS